VSEPDPLTPAERRVHHLLGELSDEQAPDGEALTRRVVGHARWQRPVRRVALTLGGAADAFGAGLASVIGAYKRR
jgi:hypothetical protein